jgi:hypothetical protein
MDRRAFLKTVSVTAVLASTKSTYGNDLQLIMLPKPDKKGGKSILEALQMGKTSRNISPRELPLQTLSNLLWAAFGINRKTASFGKPGRTAPSANHSQEIDLYVALAKGVYIYEALPHLLSPVAAGDFRTRADWCGAGTAPVNIFYVVDRSRYDLGEGQPDRSIGDLEVQKSYYYTDTGFIAQNVYLFASSQGLAAWFHNCVKQNTIKEFRLRPEQSVLFAQSVGYPG